MVDLNIEVIKGNSFHYEKEYEEILKNLQNFFSLQNKMLIVDVSIVDNQTIQKLNKEYRNKDYPTDILSFGFNQSDTYEQLPIMPLGELVISHEKVEEQAKEFGHSIKREYCYLFSHGLVHLMGYDHETKEERIEMNSIVDSIFDPLNIKREDD